VVLGVNTICTAGVGFPGGFGFLVGFLKAAFVQIFSRPNFAFERPLFVKKNGEPNEMYQSSQKNENTMFSSGNINAKSGFVTEKHNLFFPNSSFSNNDNGLGAKAYIGNCQSGVGCKV